MRRTTQDTSTHRDEHPGRDQPAPLRPRDTEGVELDEWQEAEQLAGPLGARTADDRRRRRAGTRVTGGTDVGTVTPMPIVPDTKDWTWVLERPCPECGFDASALRPTEVAGLVRENAAGWVVVLARPATELTTRPSDDRWSALEYACHVRDVLRLYDQRLALMLTEDDPDFANWDQDETAVADRYNEQVPGEVAAALHDAASSIADRFASVDGDAWQRTGNRSDGATFTVDTFARYFIHDPVHHLDDVAKGLAAVGASPEAPADG